MSGASALKLRDAGEGVHLRAADDALAGDPADRRVLVPDRLAAGFEQRLNATFETAGGIGVGRLLLASPLLLKPALQLSTVEKKGPLIIQSG